jgi:hypothetical protein
MTCPRTSYLTHAASVAEDAAAHEITVIPSVVTETGD